MSRYWRQCDLEFRHLFESLRKKGIEFLLLLSCYYFAITEGVRKIGRGSVKVQQV